MLFNSLSFLWFLPLVFLVWRLVPAMWKPVWMLAASYYFYMQWNPWFGGLLLATTLLDWYAGLRIATTAVRRVQRGWLLLSVISNLGVLAAFKYSAFFWNTGLWIGSQANGGAPDYMADWVVPVGLSFYTFQSLSYTIDVYRGSIPAEKSPLRFALFVSFFPQLVAGPIERYAPLSSQLAAPKPLRSEALAAAGRIAVWGFFKKLVIADRLAAYVDPLFTTPEQFGALTLLAGGFLFAVQVYCDFSGYTDIATGVARLFGVELMLNWRRPLLASSLHSFWARNHISMTTWFRDYLYVSLGGNRCAPWRNQVNLLLTFVLSGLWHGSSWAFVLWGTLHGVVYLLERAVRKRRTGPAPRWLRLPGWLWLICFHSLTLIAFRAGDTETLRAVALQVYNGSWQLGKLWHDLRDLHDLFPLLLAAGGIALLFAKELREEFGSGNSRLFVNVLRPAFYIGLFVLVLLIGEFGAKPFIYFAF